MAINIRKFTFRSFCKEGNIAVNVIEPEDKENVKAVLQISHGMAEHSKRYFGFAKYLASNGYAVYINDHFGHGESVSCDKEYGYLGKEGFIGLVEDMKHLKNIILKDYQGKKYFILGHSMGSFLTRYFISRYPENVSGCILSGTSAGLPLPIMKGGIAFTKRVIKKQGPKSYEKKLENLTTGSYNKKLKNPRTKADWLSRDTKVVDEYIKDPLCGFMFTSEGYHQLLELLYTVNKKEWYKLVPKDIPIFLVSGEEDPVGNFSKDLKKIQKKLINTGHSAKLKLYENDRHEILNELDKDKVYKDILQYLNSLL